MSEKYESTYTGKDLSAQEQFEQLTRVLSDLAADFVLEYKTGSIYSATKATTTSWISEAQATSVNALKVSAGTVPVNIGWGEDTTESEVSRRFVPAGETHYVAITGRYISWQSASTTGTVHLEQSVFKNV